MIETFSGQTWEELEGALNGAKVLEDLFTDLSGTRVTYDKVTDGAKLTRWLCKNAPEDLEELARLIKERLDKRERSPGEVTEA